MISVGVDVSKGKSTICVLKPYYFVLFVSVHKYLLMLILTKSRFYYNQFQKFSDYLNGMSISIYKKGIPHVTLF